LPIWDVRQLDTETCYETKLGLAKIWLRHTYYDWYVAYQLMPFTTRADLLRTYQRPVRREPPGLAPTAWRRWVFERGTRSVRLLPLAPDRSVVVQPDLPTRIPPGQRALIFVTLPLWIGVAVGEDEVNKLCEVPTTVLSNTWFGDFASGELCYSLRSRAKRKLEPAEQAVHSAVCPLQVTNASSTSLEFVHLCLQAEHLSIYQVPGRLWTNRVDVVFEGTESQITMVPAGPDTEGHATLLHPARRVAERSLVRKSFQFLKTLAGI
jgi:hypothetical protein